MLIRKRHLIFAFALCAILHVAGMRSRRIQPADPATPVATEGSFQRDGQYPGEPFVNAIDVRGWGSWSGSDENLGSITIGPFPAPRILRFGVSGYPNDPNNALYVERIDSHERRSITTGHVGERWQIIDFELPASWVKRPIRIVAHDNARTIGGWLAVTEPIRGGRGDGNNALLETISAWALNGLLLGLLYCTALRVVLSRSSLAPQWVPLGAAAIVAVFGYAAFWAYFANALLGVAFSWLVLGTGFIGSVRWARTTAQNPSKDVANASSATLREVATVLKLLVSVGAFYLAVLHLFPTAHDFYTLAANRFRDALPVDNMLPHSAAERLFASESLKNPADEWLSSDRPPLQSGWQLLTWPVTKALHLDRRVMSGTSAVWLQLLWVTAAYGMFRTFRISRARAAGWVAAMALSGFFLQNTTFTWPKLSAGAFTCGAFAVLFLRGAAGDARSNGRWAAVFAGLAWLSHGGVAFSFLPLLPFLACRALRREGRAWLPGGALLLGLVLPWLAYQTFYDPPANRLFKWHLAGQTEKDPRGTWETIRESYRQIGWRKAWSNKVSNFHGQVFGNWHNLIDVTSATLDERRNHEFFQTARALTWWPVLAALALVLTRRPIFTPGRDLAMLIGWLLLTITAWCLLMFAPYSAVIHHGSYAVMIGLFVVFSILLERAGRGWLGVTVVLQAVTLATTWVVGNPVIHGPAVALAVVIATATVLVWWVVRASVTADEGPAMVASPPIDTPTANAVPGLATAFRAWWQKPTLNVGVLIALAVFLVLRKPHALFTPQLWAEDGSIFLTQADLHGTRALVMPYMGYLHTLPRIIAWAAPRLLDPAWWPAFYNGLSFVIWLAVLARLFTRRFDLPGKPWLALALIVVPHTGEVFFNVTNLQWLTAFVLIQHVLITPPNTRAERISDSIILGLVTLTGPFGIVFLPLFAWRWWRDRRGDNAGAFAIVLVCAAIQAWFVLRTGPRFEFQSDPVRLWPNLVVLARRLVIWPMFGREAALEFSPAMVAGVGGAFLVAIGGWVLRPHPWRRLRVQILVAFALITIAAVYRTRPDTWAADNLDFGDRYFYIPRVLLAWLLILEFNAVPRFMANAARLVCLTAVAAHVHEYTLRAPRNYDWASHVEPIRQGVRADIPILPEGWTLEYRGRPGKKE